MNNPKFSELFRPGKIGGLELKNRIVMPAMGTKAAIEGHVTQRQIDYFAERAKGGVGLIITDSNCVIPGKHSQFQPWLDEDQFIPSLKKLADAVHQYGTKVAVQLSSNSMNVHLLTPSAIGSKVLGDQDYREATRDDIGYFVRSYAEAARRAKAAGLDAVEIHACHGCLSNGFLSAFINRRTDEYGGSAENRARFLCEVISQTRAMVGPDFPIIVRINGRDGFPGGTEVDDAKLQAKALASSGADAVSVTAGFHGLSTDIFPLYMHPSGCLVPLAEEIKKALDVPVIAVGKITVLLAEQVLRDGKADFVAMGRSLLADPDLPNKVRRGELDSIRPCTYCNNCHFIRSDDPVGRRRGCTVNPAMLREREAILSKVSSPKKVMVVGGGPAGLEATLILAKRGHQVTLYEKSDKLGGQWNIAAAQDGKGSYAAFTDYLIRELDQAKIPIALNQEVTRELVERTCPDEVVLATGGKPATPRVSGAYGKNVIQANDLILNGMVCGTRVVVVGGRVLGMETALALAEQGKQVSIVTLHLLGQNGVPLEEIVYGVLRDKLRLNRVPIYQNSPVSEIREEGVYVLFNMKEPVFLPADTIVLATGVLPEDRLYEEIRRLGPQVHKVGDCVKPRNAMLAVEEGFEVGMRI